MKGVKKLEERLRNALFYAGAKKGEYDAVRSRIASADRKMIQKVSSLATLLILGEFIYTFFAGRASANYIIHGIGAAASLALFVISLMYKQNDKLVLSMV